jgi:hypothetical protein
MSSTLDAAAVERLRAAVEALLTARDDALHAAVEDALYHARSLPAAVVQAVVDGGASADERVPRAVRAFSALAPAGAVFRAHAVDALPGMARAAVGGRPRRDLPHLARLVEEWSHDYGDERPVARVAAHLRAQCATLAELVDARRRAREARSREVAALSVAAGEFVRRVEALLDEVRAVFCVLGPDGVRDLARGGSDGVRDALRDIWARLLAAEEDGETLCLRTRSRPAAAASIRAALGRVESERSYCRDLSLCVPDRRRHTSRPQAGDDGDDSDSCGEWDDAVQVGGDGSESDDDEDDLAAAAGRLPEPSSLPPLAAAPDLTSAAAAGSSKRPKALRGPTARDRLKSRLGKRRKRAPITL